MATPINIVNIPKLMPEAYVETNPLARQLAQKYRELRLQALRVAPEAYASSYEHEVQRDLKHTLQRLESPEAEHFFAVDREIVKCPAKSTEQFYQKFLKTQLLGMIVLIGPILKSDVSASKDPLVQGGRHAEGPEAEGREGSAPGRPLSILHYHLNGVFVDTNCRRSGLGEALVRAAIEKRQGESRTISILVDSENEAACKLYQKVGFVVTDRETFLQQPRTLMGEVEARERVAIRLEVDYSCSA